MVDLKTAELLRQHYREKEIEKVGERKFLTPYKKCYQVGEVICLIGFYSLKHNEKSNLTIAEMEELFRKRKIKSTDVKFDVKHLVVSEEHEYTLSKHGFIAFNDKVTPTLIAVNQYPNFADSYESTRSWRFIELQEYFKDNPITNLEYIDYKFAVAVMSDNEVIPKRVTRTLSIVVNSYFENINANI